MIHTRPEAQMGPQRSDDPLNESVSSLSVELTRISAEIQSINSGFQAGLQQAITDVRAAIENHYKQRFEQAIANVRKEVREELLIEFRAEFRAELERRVAGLSNVRQEIERVAEQLEGVTKEITAMLDDPSIELSRVMRKRTEQAELKAYLNGLRYSIGDETKTKSAGA